MTGSVKECNDLFSLKSNGIGSDMLCYAASLTGYHVGVADIVKELGLAMVNVSHHSDNRGPWPEHAFIIFLLLHCLLQLGADELYRESELLSYQRHGFCVKPLVYRDNKPEAHTGGDDINHRHVHHCCHLINGNELRNLENALFKLPLFGLVLHPLADGIALVTAVLGHPRLALAHQEVDIPDILLDVFPVNLRSQGAVRLFPVAAVILL